VCYRGRSTYSFPVQAAERRIREEAPLLTAVAIEPSAPASDNGHGQAAPAQLALEWPEIALLEL
jgi:hypothetical protein